MNKCNTITERTRNFGKSICPKSRARRLFVNDDHTHTHTHKLPVNYGELKVVTSFTMDTVIWSIGEPNKTVLRLILPIAQRPYCDCVAGKTVRNCLRHGIHSRINILMGDLIYGNWLINRKRLLFGLFYGFRVNLYDKIWCLLFVFFFRCCLHEPVVEWVHFSFVGCRVQQMVVSYVDMVLCYFLF